MVTAYLVVFSVWLTAWIDSESRMRLVLRALLVAAVFSAVVGALAPFLPLAAADSWHNDGRAKAFFEDPNVFGPFLVFPTLILVEELLQPRLLRSGRAMKLALLFVLSIGVLFAYSRAAWLNAAVAALTMFAVFALRRGGGRKAFVLVGTMAAALIVLFGAIVVSGSGEFFEERARFQQYDEDRFAAQRPVWSSLHPTHSGSAPASTRRSSGTRRTARTSMRSRSKDFSDCSRWSCSS